MTKRSVSFVIGLVVIAGFLTAGRAQAAPRIYVEIGPPAAVVEAPPPVPRPGLVWRPGYHRWIARRYEWVPGEWVRPPRPHALWVPGRWVHERRGWYWVPGHWGRR